MAFSIQSKIKGIMDTYCRENTIKDKSTEDVISSLLQDGIPIPIMDKSTEKRAHRTLIRDRKELDNEENEGLRNLIEFTVAEYLQEMVERDGDDDELRYHHGPLIKWTLPTLRHAALHRKSRRGIPSRIAVPRKRTLEVLGVLMEEYMDSLVSEVAPDDACDENEDEVEEDDGEHGLYGESTSRGGKSKEQRMKTDPMDGSGDVGDFDDVHVHFNQTDYI